MYQGCKERDEEGGSEVGKGGQVDLVKIRSIYGQKVGAFEGEELGGREESRGTGKEASSRHPGVVLSQLF